MKLFRLVLVVFALVGATLSMAQTTSMKLTVKGKGDVVIELFTKEAPNTTAHIIGLVEKGFYDGQKFFGTMKEPRPYMIKFGDPQTKTKAVTDSSIGTGGSGSKIAYEDSGKQNVKGAVGLSTLQRDRDSGDSQFYILLDNRPFLNGSYTVFGRVTKGMDIVESIGDGDQVTSVTIVRG